MFDPRIAFQAKVAGTHVQSLTVSLLVSERLMCVPGTLLCLIIEGSRGGSMM